MTVRLSIKQIFMMAAIAITAAGCGLTSTPQPTPVSTVDTIVLPTAVITAAPTGTIALTQAPVMGKINQEGGTSNVNVRRGPGTSFEPVGKLMAGKDFQITGKSPNSEWWRVKADGVEGWVYTRFVAAEGNLSDVPCIASADSPCPVEPVEIAGNDPAVLKIRALLGNPEQPLFFRGEADNPNADMRKSLVYVDEKGGEYWVDQAALQVVQWTAYPGEKSVEVKTLDGMRAIAKALAQSQSRAFKKKSESLKYSEISKDGSSFAFRWEDQAQTGHSLFPFLQVVVRTDGKITNYHNTLDLFEP
jgi:uncharacterized protein YgiM (DUF1202 family)